MKHIDGGALVRENDRKRGIIPKFLGLLQTCKVLCLLYKQ